MDISKVTRVAIYPSIGVARVGNSPEEYFLGPKIPGQHPSDPDDFRDKKGRIKRQAVQFFIYGLDAKGKILGEINIEQGAEIVWDVEIANKKAAWYNFDIALDIPAAKGEFDADGNSTPGSLPVLSQKRNQDFEGAERQKLMITPSAKTISGKNVNHCGGGYAFDDGTINQLAMYLGELRTDQHGRLIFLGGLGKSDSFNAKPLSTFANNQGWYDDTSDGPVEAKVTLPDGRVLCAEGAWVVTAPPNFAVGVQAFTTGYELLQDVESQTRPELK